MPPNLESLAYTRNLQSIYGHLALECACTGIILVLTADLSGSDVLGISGLISLAGAVISGTEWNDCMTAGDKIEQQAIEIAIAEIMDNA